MKKIILVYSLALLGVFSLTSMTNPSADMIILLKKQYTKTIEKSFDISKNGEVVLINKYGNIDMNTWDKNEVKITVNIVVNATSQSVAEDVFERISILFDDSKDRVSAQTEIESQDSYWWNWGRSLKSDYEINYKIFMPISCSADFTNKYGNIDMMDLENNAQINVKYGDLTMGDLEGNLNISVGYGNAFIGSVEGDVVAEISYSKFRCESLNDFSGQSKYSGVKINNGNRVVTESKYDNYQLGTIGSFMNEGKYDNFILESVKDFTVETKYTDVKIGSLTNSLRVDMSYGGIKVSELKKGFNDVTVESSYANVTLGMEAGTGFDLDLNAKYVDVSVPETKGMQDDQDGSERRIRASYQGSSRGRIQAEMEYGQFKIK